MFFKRNQISIDHRPLEYFLFHLEWTHISKETLYVLKGFLLSNTLFKLIFTQLFYLHNESIMPMLRTEVNKSDPSWDLEQWRHPRMCRDILNRNEPLKNNLLRNIEIYVVPNEKAIFQYLKVLRSFQSNTNLGEVLHSDKKNLYNI